MRRPHRERDKDPAPLTLSLLKGPTASECNVNRYKRAYLRDMIIAGKAKPSLVVSHTVSLDDAANSGADDSTAIDHLSLAEVLVQLESLSERQATVVKLRFYGGLKIEEIALFLGVSDRTVKSDWRVARAWLMDRLE